MLGQRPAGESYKDEIRAVVVDQYLPIFSVPVLQIAVIYHLTARANRDILKFLIRSYVLAKSMSQRQFASAFEWEKTQG